MKRIAALTVFLFLTGFLFVPAHAATGKTNMPGSRVAGSLGVQSWQIVFCPRNGKCRMITVNNGKKKPIRSNSASFTFTSVN